MNKALEGLSQVRSYTECSRYNTQVCRLLSCHKQELLVASHSLGSMQDTGCLGLVHWMTQRDGMGREVEEGFRIGNTCTPVADTC